MILPFAGRKFSFSPFVKKNNLIDLRGVRPDIPEMAATALIPPSAPFGDDDRDHLDRVLSTASPTQRAWLAGFLAGLDARRGPAAVPDAPAARCGAADDPVRERIRQLRAPRAATSAKLARKSGFKPKIVDFADLDLAAPSQEPDASSSSPRPGAKASRPARAAHGYAELMGAGGAAPRRRHFAVLALGDTAYAEFCAVGKAIDAGFAELGATRAVERIDCDLDFEEPAAAWIKGTLETLAPAARDRRQRRRGRFRGRAPRTRSAASRSPAEVTEHINLNSSRSDKETIHLALGFDGAAPAYEPGDSLELFPENDPALVDAVLAAKRACRRGRLAPRADQRARHHDAFAQDPRDVRRATGHARRASASSTRATARAWIEGRQLDRSCREPSRRRFRPNS